MQSIVVKDRSGQDHVIPAEAGKTIMEIARDGGIDEMLALCGGCLSCATCHVFVDEAHRGRFPAMSQDENDLLDSSDHRRGESRLACQLAFDPSFDGLRVALAPED